MLAILNKLRTELDQCDQELAKLFKKRQQIIAQVANYKREKGLPIYVPQREKEILKRFTGLEREFFRSILQLSRLQQSLYFFPYNIVLIGFMGTGKSSVGRQLAENLGRQFVDLDELFEIRFQTSIASYFSTHGETSFRREEANLIGELATQEGLVIATGGGAILYDENVVNLKKQGRLVLLTAKSETIYTRLKEDQVRPLLKGENPLATIEKLMARRASLYKQAADLRVSTDGLSLGEVVQEIFLGLLKL